MYAVKSLHSITSKALHLHIYLRDCYTIPVMGGRNLHVLAKPSKSSRWRRLKSSPRGIFSPVKRLQLESFELTDWSVFVVGLH